MMEEKRLERVESDLIGYGSRLNVISETQGRQDERIKANKVNITDLWSILNEMRAEIKTIHVSISMAINKVLLIVAVPTILVLYQLINTALKSGS